MSSVEIRLSSFILKDHFGENVEKIVVYLLHKGRKSLRSICSDTDLDKNLVLKLCPNLVIFPHFYDSYDSRFLLESHYHLRILQAFEVFVT